MASPRAVATCPVDDTGINVALRSSALSRQGPPLGPYRWADYDALPDEPRCEPIWGRF
jgi:hypothetical protein